MSKLLRFSTLLLLAMVCNFALAGGKATMTVSGQTYDLSEEVAISFGELPAGTTFSYTCSEEDTKTVTFQIYDVTAQSILKSVTSKQDQNGLAGEVVFELPIKYALAQGHQYEAQFKEFASMSTLNKTPVAEHNYKFDGTADVAVYSTVKVASVMPTTNEVITRADEVVYIQFTEAIASLRVRAIKGQMDFAWVDAADITTADNILWTIKLNKNYFSQGSLNLSFYATDKEGNHVTDEQNGVGSPESCYVNYGWTSSVGLPTPKMAQDGKTFSSLAGVTFTYQGIGLNLDMATATWDQITVEKDGDALEMKITENLFAVSGDASVGGTQLDLTFPEPIKYNGKYTVKLPAFAFMLGHDQSNFYSGEATYTFTIEGGEDLPVAGPAIVANITKTSWATIGTQYGETIGTVSMTGTDAFDHIEAEIRCVEDADQYITFANVNTNGGSLICYAPEGSLYHLNKGYHYLLIVKGFDVPYYGVAPVATDTIAFVGEGKEPTTYSDIVISEVHLKPNTMMVNGYDINGSTFDVTFSAPVSRVQAWWAKGFEGSERFTAEKKTEDGLTWTIIMSEDAATTEGSVNVMITAWDKNGVQVKGETGDHAFAYNLFISSSDPTGILTLAKAEAQGRIFTLAGIRIQAAQMKKGVTYIVNGKKVVLK